MKETKEKPKVWKWVVSRWYFWLIVVLRVIFSEEYLPSLTDPPLIIVGYFSYVLGVFLLVLVIFAFFRFIYLKIKKK